MSAAATAAATAVPEVDYSLSNSDVVTKYRAAADITARALTAVIAACAPGAKILDLCVLGDKTIEDGAKSVYNKSTVGKDMLKGIAFPTTVSVGAVVCHFTPLPSDPEAAAVLVNGDVVKIQLGTHVDGLAAITAHTLIVGASASTPATGRAADVTLAAYHASEAALRLIKPGNTNFQITETVQKITDAYACKPIQGQISHPTARNELEHGTKSIILNPTPEQTKSTEKCAFAEGEVWIMDVVVSTGEGKSRDDGNKRTTVYKRSGTQYQLKMKASRATLAELKEKFGMFPFSLRSMEDERRARMGIIECAKQGVVSAFPVHDEKEGEVVAQFLFTVLLSPGGGVVRLTPSVFDAQTAKSDKKIDDEEILKLLATGAGSKKNRRKKKTAADKDEEAA